MQLLDPNALATRIHAKLLDPQTQVSLREFVSRHEWDAYDHFDFAEKRPSFYKDLN